MWREAAAREPSEARVGGEWHALWGWQRVSWMLRMHLRACLRETLEHIRYSLQNTTIANNKVPGTRTHAIANH